MYIDSETAMDVFALYVKLKNTCPQSRMRFKDNKELLKRLGLGKNHFIKMVKHPAFGHLFKYRKGVLQALRCNFKGAYLSFIIDGEYDSKKDIERIKIKKENLNSYSYIKDRIKVAIFCSSVRRKASKMDVESKDEKLSKLQFSETLCSTLNYNYIAKVVGSNRAKTIQIVSDAVNDGLIKKQKIKTRIDSFKTNEEAKEKLEIYKKKYEKANANIFIYYQTSEIRANFANAYAPMAWEKREKNRIYGVSLKKNDEEGKYAKTKKSVEIQKQTRDLYGCTPQIKREYFSDSLVRWKTETIAAHKQEQEAKRENSQRRHQFAVEYAERQIENEWANTHRKDEPCMDKLFIAVKDEETGKIVHRMAEKYKKYYETGKSYFDAAMKQEKKLEVMGKRNKAIVDWFVMQKNQRRLIESIYDSIDREIRESSEGKSSLKKILSKISRSRKVKVNDYLTITNTYNNTIKLMLNTKYSMSKGIITWVEDNYLSKALQAIYNTGVYNLVSCDRYKAASSKDQDLSMYQMLAEKAIEEKRQQEAQEAVIRMCAGRVPGRRHGLIDGAAPDQNGGSDNVVSSAEASSVESLKPNTGYTYNTSNMYNSELSNNRSEDRSEFNSIDRNEYYLESKDIVEDSNEYDLFHDCYDTDVEDTDVEVEELEDIFN